MAEMEIQPKEERKVRKAVGNKQLLVALAHIKMMPKKCSMHLIFSLEISVNTRIRNSNLKFLVLISVKDDLNYIN